MTSLSSLYVRFRESVGTEGLSLDENSFVCLWDFESGSLQIKGHCFFPVPRWKYLLLGATHYLSFEIRVRWDPKASTPAYREARTRNLLFLVRQLGKRLMNFGHFLDVAITDEERDILDRRLAVWFKEVRNGKAQPKVQIHRTKNWRPEN